MNALTDNLKTIRLKMDDALDSALPVPPDLTAEVTHAMRYSAIGKGKAFRPFLIMTVGEMYGLSDAILTPVATALEMVHTYSLIHDDLPAMDNDTLRRGKPTCHIQFNEATAILAGDGLLTKAFEVLTQSSFHIPADKKVKLVALLADAAGTSGMIGGQIIDLAGEKSPLTLVQIRHTQRLKTGALLRFACLAPAVLADADTTEWQALTRYSDALGELFQTTDDLLDETSSAVVLGKSIGKDKTAHKSTFVTLLGMDGARKAAQNAHQAAVQALSVFGDKADLLRQTADYVLTRDK